MALRPEPKVEGFFDDVWDASKTAADAVLNKDQHAKERAQQQQELKAAQANAQRMQVSHAALTAASKAKAGSNTTMLMLAVVAYFVLVKGKR